MEVNKKENEPHSLHVYSINEHEHIGAINVTTGGTDTYRAIVILDSSLAAESVAPRFVKQILPLVLSKVKNWHSSVHLITFGEECDCNYVSKGILSSLDLNCVGAANIAPAIEKLRSHLESCVANARDLFELLTISAGEVNDRQNAEQETKKLTDFLSKRGWRINSQAVRMFPSSNAHQLEAKALSYLLQINNSTAANICDVHVASSNEMIANEIAALFPANEHRYAVLNVDKPISLRYPWKSFQWHIFVATMGWNIFWMKQLPTAAAVKFQENPIDVVMEGQLTLATFQELMGKILPQIVSRIAILKIVGTAEADETVDNIFSYFANTEDALAVKGSTPNNKIVTTALAEIATYKPNFQDSAEMIDFHRNPSKAMEDRKERLKREEQERLKREEQERLKQEEEERQKRAEQERLHRKEMERRMQEEDERRKQEEERFQREEEERLKREDGKRLKPQPGENEEEQHQKRIEEEEEEKERKRQAEEECLRRLGKLAGLHEIGPNNNLIQTVFILDQRSANANVSRWFTEEIVPLLLSKTFESELVQMVTFLRHMTTTAQTIQSLVRALDATKRIRISVLTSAQDHELGEIELFAATVIQFLHQSGYSAELQVVRITMRTPLTGSHNLVSVDVGNVVSN